MGSRPKSDREYFDQGIELFNAERFFECHEAWEQVWLRSSGEHKQFLQGLIQAAVAILHAERENRDGARTLYAKARVKLDHLPAEYEGVAVGKLLEDLQSFFAAALKADANALPSRPKLRKSN